MPIRTGNPMVGLRRTSTTKSFTGASGAGSTATNTTLFQVTGDVHIGLIVPSCITDFASSASGVVTLGVTNNTTLFITSTSNVDIDAGEFWFTATPTANGAAVPAAMKDIAITDNIIMSHNTAATTAGEIRVDVYWLPLSANGLVAPGP